MQRLASRRSSRASSTADVTQAVAAPLNALRESAAQEKPKLATRKSSENALGVINAATTATIGGSADLTHSVFTLTKGLGVVAPENFSGRYIHFGVREFGMAAARNGLALHGGFIRFVGTFLVFADYAPGPIRLSALMGQRVSTCLLTIRSASARTARRTSPSSISRASARCPTSTCSARPTPSDGVLGARAQREIDAVRASLSRQNLPTLETARLRDPFGSGGYVLQESEGGRDVTLIATGSEVSMALEAAKLLAAKESARRSSLCRASSSSPRRRRLSRQGAGLWPRVGVEAAVRFGWDRWLGERSAFIGMSGFGASAPADALYATFRHHAGGGGEGGGASHRRLRRQWRAGDASARRVIEPSS